MQSWSRPVVRHRNQRKSRWKPRTDCLRKRSSNSITKNTQLGRLARMEGVYLPAATTEQLGCRRWRRGDACVRLKATLAASGAWHGVPTSDTHFPAVRMVTTLCDYGRSRRGDAYACSKAMREGSTAWRRARISCRPSLVQMTVRCGCGNLRQGAVCACSKAIPRLSCVWRGVPTNAMPSAALLTTQFAFGIWRQGIACAFWRDTRRLY